MLIAARLEQELIWEATTFSLTPTPASSPAVKNTRQGENGKLGNYEYQPDSVQCKQSP